MTFTECQNEMEEEIMKKTKWKKIVSFITLLVMLVSLLTVSASAASYPIMILLTTSSNMTILEGDTGEMVFSILRKYNNERYFVNVYDESNALVATADGSLYSYGSSFQDVKISVDTKALDMKPGKYKVEYYMTFYSWMEWHEIPNRSHSTLTVIDKSICNGNHNYTERVITAPTCENAGKLLKTCSKCQYEIFETLPKTHTWDNGVETSPATCQAEGVKTYTCTGCKTTKTESIPKVAHSWDWDNGIVVTAATLTRKGEVIYSCFTCDAKNHVDIPATFSDILADAYYEKPVIWAYEKGITTGTTANTFGPGVTCSRAQVVTFLWRAVGSPEPVTTVNPFVDVPSSAYYYKAVLWAYENNITTGTSATTFSPGDACTRGHVVTFLWRTEDQPTASTSSSFSDVSDAAYYNNAVSWAVESGITNGIGGGKFAPGNACTRAQIVTFLYRDLYKA